jgi:uracil-DNA glycosylase
MAVTRKRQLTLLQQTIRECTRCVDAGYLTRANPIVRGGVASRGMLIGQAPGLRADRANVPWSGPAGNLLRSWFARAGYDPECFLDDWYFAAITRCFPGKAASGPGDRVPSRAERALCRPHLDAEIALVRPTVVITLGRLATDTFIPGAKRLTFRELIGTVYPVDLGYGPVPFVPLPHPSGVGRWLNDPTNRALVETAMDRLREIRADLERAA